MLHFFDKMLPVVDLVAFGERLCSIDKDNFLRQRFACQSSTALSLHILTLPVKDIPFHYCVTLPYALVSFPFPKF